MIKLDLKIKKSIYEQIVDGFKEEIVSGRLAPGDQLPSVRDLSARLTVNPNTIQKAFKALESQGYIYPVSGRGNFVSESISQASDKQKDEIYAKIAAAVDELRYLGVGMEEIAGRIAAITGAKAQTYAQGTEERRGGDDQSK